VEGLASDQEGDGSWLVLDLPISTIPKD
jgi:hypothetical protein